MLEIISVLGEIDAPIEQIWIPEGSQSSTGSTSLAHETRHSD